MVQHVEGHAADQGQKSGQDITALSRQLLKLTVESALKAELDEHLGYERHAPAPLPWQSASCQPLT